MGVEIDKLILKLYENAPKLLLCYSNPDSAVVAYIKMNGLMGQNTVQK